MREAIEEADDISEARGGSTITQQIAKNLFLWPGRSFVRKALELPLALWIDLVLPKRRVLEIYLNIAEWGPNGEFGAEAGSRHAFNKPARLISAREAALLAAVLPNPRRRSPAAAAGSIRLAAIRSAPQRPAASASCVRKLVAYLRSRRRAKHGVSSLRVLPSTARPLALEKAFLYKPGFQPQCPSAPRKQSE